MNCAFCMNKNCSHGKDCFDLDIEYNSAQKEILKAAASLEASGYMKLTRLEELIEFSKAMSYERLGFAFCIGLSNEAYHVAKILSRDFNLFSVCCKVSGLKKEDLNLKDFSSGSKCSCNPLGQARILNDKDTDLNILLGLCMGHDILFSENSNAPVTTLAVKDRVLAHNPLGALYSGYYRRKRFDLD